MLVVMGGVMGEMKYTWIALHPPRLLCDKVFDTYKEAEACRNECWGKANERYPVMEYEAAKKLCNSLWSKFKWAVLCFLSTFTGG